SGASDSPAHELPVLPIPWQSRLLAQFRRTLYFGGSGQAEGEAARDYKSRLGRRPISTTGVNTAGLSSRGSLGRGGFVVGAGTVSERGGPRKVAPLDGARWFQGSSPDSRRYRLRTGLAYCWIR